MILHKNLSVPSTVQNMGNIIIIEMLQDEELPKLILGFNSHIYLAAHKGLMLESFKALLKSRFIISTASSTPTKPVPCYKRKPDR